MISFCDKGNDRQEIKAYLELQLVEKLVFLSDCCLLLSDRPLGFRRPLSCSPSFSSFRQQFDLLLFPPLCTWITEGSVDMSLYSYCGTEAPAVVQSDGCRSCHERGIVQPV